MTPQNWDCGFGRALAVYFNGHGIPNADHRGRPIVDDSFLLCFNAHHDTIDFLLPSMAFGVGWQPVIDTAAATSAVHPVRGPRSVLTVRPRTLVVLRSCPPPAATPTTLSQSNDPTGREGDGSQRREPFSAA